MARCESCNKFTALTFEEPEVEQEVQFEDGAVSAVVRIVRNSECCGDEKKEATLEMSCEIDHGAVFVGHVGPEGEEIEGHELEIEADDPEQIEEGGGRFAKSYFGASIGFRVRCSCQEKDMPPLYEGTLSDKVVASQMDEC